MAVITGITTADVRRMFARGDDAIVAGTTGPDDLGVINCGRRSPQRTVVAVLADIGRRDMQWTLAGGGGAIVTTDAVARDAGVIEGGRQPGHRCVAVITGIATADMGRVFARGNDAIVAGAAGADDLGVVDPVGRNPDDVVMAVLAHI